MRVRLVVLIFAASTLVANAQHSFKTLIGTTQGTNVVVVTSVSNLDLSFALNTNEFKAGDSLTLSCTVSNTGTEIVRIDDIYLELSSCWSLVDWTRLTEPEPFDLNPKGTYTVKRSYSVPERITFGQRSKRSPPLLDEREEKMMRESDTPIPLRPPVFTFDTTLALRLHQDGGTKLYSVWVKVDDIRVRK